MREVADAERIKEFMRALGREADADARVYLTGGATAVLFGWRRATIDVDVKIVPEQDALLKAIPSLKERLRINVELASPIDFIPVPAGWEDRSMFIERQGKADFYHFDVYAQALAKVERSHALDLEDVQEMIRRDLIDPAEARRYFRLMEPNLYRFPAIDPPSFRAAVMNVFGDMNLRPA